MSRVTRRTPPPAPESTQQPRVGASRLDGAWRRLPIALAAALGLVTSPSIAQTPADVPAPEVIFASLSATDAARRAAADRLLAVGNLGPLISALGGAPGPLRDAACAAIAGCPPPAPAEALAPLLEAMAGCHPAEARALVQALGRYRTREAIRAVARTLEGPAPPAVVEAAVGALTRQTGREDLGADPQRWREWWREAQWLPPLEWAEQTGAAQGLRAARLDAERGALAVQLVEAQRRLYALTPAEERTAFLVRLMTNAEPTVRLLGFELAERALLDARRLDAPVAEAALARLADERARVRAAAASLTGRLAPAEAPARRGDALQREIDVGAAAALLDALARWPSPALADSAILWLGRPEPAASAAARALTASARRGVLDDASRRRASLGTLHRAADASALTPSMILLLGAIGDEPARQRLVHLLDATAPEVRLAAAEAIGQWPDGVAMVLEAASRDPVLFDAAIVAVISHDATAAGYARLAAITGVPTDTRSAGLRRLALAMTPAQVVKASRAASSGLERAALLRTAFEAGVEVEGDPDRSPQLRLALAEALVESQDFEGALGVLDRAASPGADVSSSLQEDLIRVRIVVLLCLGRFEDAERLPLDAQAWERAAACAAAAGRPHAPAIVERMRVLFGVS